MSSHPAHGKVLSIRDKVLSVYCDRSVIFSGYSGFLHQKTYHHDLAEILSKVALNIIILTLKLWMIMTNKSVEISFIVLRLLE